jgi:hypothetical protein
MTPRFECLRVLTQAYISLRVPTRRFKHSTTSQAYSLRLGFLISTYSTVDGADNYARRGSPHGPASA